MNENENLMNAAFEVIKKLESENESDELTEKSKEALIEVMRTWTRPFPIVDLVSMHGPTGITVPFTSPIYMDYLYKDEKQNEQH
jgi:hypothetical protein